MPPDVAGSTALRHRVMIMRTVTYGLACVGTSIAALVSGSTSLAMAAALSGVSFGWSVALRDSSEAHAMTLLIIDSAGTWALWWLFGPSPVVDFLLFYVVAASALLLSRPRAIHVTLILLGLTGGQLFLHLSEASSRLPLFHAHAADDWFIEIIERGLLIGGCTVLFASIATMIRTSQSRIAASEQRFRDLVEASPDGIVVHSPAGIVFANPAAAALLRAPSPARLLGSSLLDAVEPEGRALAAERLAAVLRGEKADLAELPMTRLDDARIRVEHVAIPVTYHGRACAQIILRDVTEQKRAEQALEESEVRFRTAFQAAPIGMALVEPNGTILRLNDMLSDILGWPPDEMLGRPVARFIHPDDQTEFRRLMQALRAGELSARAELRLRHAEGNEVWTNLSAALSRDATGAPRHIVTQFEDISDRRQAEATMRRLVDILEATPDLVVIADYRGRITYANRAAKTFYRLGGDPSTLTVTDILDAEGLEETLAAIRSADVWNGALRLRQPDGNTVPASTVIVNHRGPDGRIERFSAIARDMTENIRNQERLERLVRSKDDFVASVSHELRTPLTAVVGLAQELRNSWETFSRAEIAEFIDLVAEQSTEVANIVEDLLVAARADIGKVVINASPVDIGEQVETVLAALSTGQSIAVSTASDQQAAAWADAARVRQILRNLLTNAARYGGNSVDLSVASQNGSVHITVRDDGPGIPAESREKIFQPYERAHNTAGQPASVGLGLTISRQLARLMGGDLTYRYEGDRSHFELTLPAAPLR